MRPGDLVVLRSGGPVLTVGVIAPPGAAPPMAVEVIWFCGPTMQRAIILEDCLRLATGAEARAALGEPSGATA
jgi:hypothetical protein